MISKSRLQIKGLINSASRRPSVIGRAPILYREMGVGRFKLASCFLRMLQGRDGVVWIDGRDLRDTRLPYPQLREGAYSSRLPTHRLVYTCSRPPQCN